MKTTTRAWSILKDFSRFLTSGGRSLRAGARYGAAGERVGFPHGFVNWHACGKKRSQSADEGVAGAGRVDRFYVGCGEMGRFASLDQERSAFAQCDDHGRTIAA